ncbi:hypothetical protein N7468_003722 [Penicillium chermesinum]|uniref:Uncharacterized protein n=1 Tax=Penicillium chermesinum TaxID=63820 RepID=A0A9W9P717_9EURO|nr:uncharacterized protein N7468_003722 [Penicillium chermesinum]KAJ5239103.1 hypothetical protein N7468_003722 [Penicillium chermesinum]KAJ6164743.1 hypothetical protein N7470_003415 [Penicillium chermesinum]
MSQKSTGFLSPESDDGERPETDYERWLRDQHANGAPPQEAPISPGSQPPTPLYGDRASAKDPTIDPRSGLKSGLSIYILLTIIVVVVVMTRLQKRRRRSAVRTGDP